jgi:hypothetical protein
MCEYLYAQFSLKRAVGEGVTAEQLARVQAWEATLVDVIKQEMLRLALATNILTGVGAAPHFRASEPADPVAVVPAGSSDRPAALRGAGAAALHVSGAPGGDAVGRRRRLRCASGHPAPAAADASVMAVPEAWRTVGHLYRGIEAGLAQLCRRYGEDAVFIGPPTAQAVTATFEWTDLAAVTDLASASRAIELIVEQGEGAPGDWPDSHFGRFVGILEDFLTLKGADAGFEPARPVEPACVRLPADVASGT